MNGQRLLVSLFSLLIISVDAHGSELSNSEKAVSNNQQAQACTGMISRVERLECYDAIFMAQIATPATNAKLIQSASWYRATQSEKRRASEQLSGWVKSQESDETGSEALWFTVASDTQPGKEDAKVILQASCIKDISRLELVLAQPVTDSRALISLGGQSTPWTFDEQGLVLRSGRGLSAIDIMRPLMHKKALTLRANIAQLDGLTFTTPNAKQSFAALKELCGW